MSASSIYLVPGHTTCKECGSIDTSLEMQVDRGGGLVRFRVDCNRCGGTPHYLPYTEINRAVKRWLKEHKCLEIPS